MEKKMDHHVTRNIIVTDGTGKVAEVIPVPFADDTDTTIKDIVSALGGEAAFMALPVLDLGEQRGGTGYIDFLEHGEVTAPVMRGTDTHGRPFVAVRMEYTQSSGEVILCVEVLFRRYTTGPVWVSGGRDGGGQFLCRSAFGSADLGFFRRLIAGEDMGKRRYSWLSPELREQRLAEAQAKGRNLKIDGDDLCYEVGTLRIA